MKLAARLKPLQHPIDPGRWSCWSSRLLTQLLGISLLTRIVTVMFINLILVLGLQVFMGNSGILSFAHIGFMGIGAYTSVLFSMTPEAKAADQLRPVSLPGPAAPALPAFPADRRAGGGPGRRADQLPAHAPVGCGGRHHHLRPAGHHPRGAGALGPGHQRPAHPVRRGQLHHLVDQRGLCGDHHLRRLLVQGVAHRAAAARLAATTATPPPRSASTWW